MFQSKALHQQEDLHTEAESSRGKLFLRRGSSSGKQRSASPTSVASKGARRRASSVERLLDLFRGRSYNELDDDDARKHDDALSQRAPDTWAWPHLRETGFKGNRRATVDGATRPAPEQPKKSPRRIRSLGDILQGRRRRAQASTTLSQNRSAQNSASTTPTTTSAAPTQASSILVRERSVHLSALQEGDRDAIPQQEDSVANKRDEFGRQTSLQKLWSMTQSMRPAESSSSQELDDDTSTDAVPDRDSDDEQELQPQQEQQEQQQPPAGMQRAYVRVPQNAVPGDRVLARLKNGRQVSFEIPSGAFPGDMLVLTLPHIVDEEAL